MSMVVRTTLRSVGTFSQRDIVGCEHRSSPLSGKRPQASLKPGSSPAAQMIEVVSVLITASDREHAGTQNVADAVRDQ